MNSHWNVIELWDSKTICSNDFTLLKGNKCNYVHLKKIEIKLNNFVWTKSQ
jgi:hypothetical protein